MPRYPLALLVLLALLAAACAGSGGPPPVEPVEVPPGDAEALAGSTNAFAFDLYRRLPEDEANRFLSPLSIHAALAMTAGGAEGETAVEIRRALHLDLPEERALPAWQSLFAGLRSDLEKDDQELAVASAVWLQEGLAFRAGFMERLARHYGAEARPADFRGAAETARRTIDEWVSDRTRGHIDSLFPPGAITPATLLVLANAVWFQGGWTKEFDPDDTRREPFHLAGGDTVQADLMHQTGHFSWGEADGVQMLEMGYRGGRLAMLVLLPAEPDGLPALERSLDAKRLAEWTRSLGYEEVIVTLPRFRLRCREDLAAPLEEMGVRRVFAPGSAELGGMSDAGGLYLAAMAHQAWVEVDEVGTRAAAATGSVIGAAIREGGPKMFRADRPFLFLIRDRRTGTVLFLGRLARPEQAG